MVKPVNAKVAANGGPIVFVGSAYVLSIALSLIIGSTGGYRSRFIGLGYVSMFIPTLSVLITKFTTHEKIASMGWNRFPLQDVPAALLLMPLIMHIAMLPAATLLGGLRWQEWLTPGVDS